MTPTVSGLNTLTNFATSQWNSSFGTPSAQQVPVTAGAGAQPHHNSSLSLPHPTGAAEVPTIQDIQHVHATVPSIASAAAAQQHAQQQAQQQQQQQQQQQISPHTQYSAAPVQSQTFVTPAMWQESVASVYEGGLKRGWDYDTRR